MGDYLENDRMRWPNSSQERRQIQVAGSIRCNKTSSVSIYKTAAKSSNNIAKLCFQQAEIARRRPGDDGAHFLCICRLGKSEAQVHIRLDSALVSLKLNAIFRNECAMIYIVYTLFGLVPKHGEQPYSFEKRVLT
jgi:hypothetical protein